MDESKEPGVPGCLGVPPVITFCNYTRTAIHNNTVSPPFFDADFGVLGDLGSAENSDLTGVVLGSVALFLDC